MTGTNQTTGVVTLDEALAELGQRSHAYVARVLHAAGVRGIKGDAYDCPIARYLRMRTGMTGIGVGPRGVYEVLGDCTCGTSGCTLKQYGRQPLPHAMPREVADFILLFDQGAYGALIEA